MTDSDIAWAAGFFDGEGCITFMERSGRYYCSISTSQYYDGRSIIFFKILFGGRVNQKLRNGAPLWTWTQYGKDALHTLSLVRPYLKRKDREADLLFEYGKIKYGNLYNKWSRGNSGEEQFVLRLKQLRKEII